MAKRSADRGFVAGSIEFPVIQHQRHGDSDAGTVRPNETRRVLQRAKRIMRVIQPGSRTSPTGGTLAGTNSAIGGLPRGEVGFQQRQVIRLLPIDDRRAGGLPDAGMRQNKFECGADRAHAGAAVRPNRDAARRTSPGPARRPPRRPYRNDPGSGSANESASSPRRCKMTSLRSIVYGIDSSRPDIDLQRKRPVVLIKIRRVIVAAFRRQIERVQRIGDRRTEPAALLPAGKPAMDLAALQHGRALLLGRAIRLATDRAAARSRRSPAAPAPAWWRAVRPEQCLGIRVAGRAEYLLAADRSTAWPAYITGTSSATPATTPQS